MRDSATEMIVSMTLLVQYLCTRYCEYNVLLSSTISNFVRRYMHTVTVRCACECMFRWMHPPSFRVHSVESCQSILSVSAAHMRRVRVHSRTARGTDLQTREMTRQLSDTG